MNRIQDSGFGIQGSEVLRLSGITKTYLQGATEVTPLRDFSLTIEKGESVALVGPSGSGKTTLLQIAGLLDTPTTGEVWIAGRDMSRANDALRTQTRRGSVGFVYQFHHLLPEFSALENIVLPQLIAGKPRAAAEEKAKDLLATLGLAERLSHRPAALSGGECQRVAIARALANDPALLLADEPTGNLDHHNAEQVFALLLKLAKEQGVGMLVATHNMELAGRMGRVVKLGS